MNLRRLGVDHVADGNHGRGGQGAFVDRAENHAVAVGVDEAGGDVLALGVDHVGVFGCLKVAPDLFDFTVGNQQVVFFQDTAFAAGPKRCVPDEHGGWLEHVVFADRRAGEPRVRFLLFFIVRFFVVFFLFVLFLLFIDPGECLRLERRPAALDPEALELGLGVEVIALNDDEVGQFAWLDSAKLITCPGEFRRRGGQRGECVALGQAALDDLGQVLPECLLVLDPVSGECDLDAVLMQ